MAYDKNVSPVGWYVGSYLLRFVELQDADRNDPEKRFLSWENTVLVQAESLDLAYAKVEKIARSAARPYRGGAEGVPVRWEYLGVTGLLPIYEKLEDGSEIAWAEHSPRKSKNLKQCVKPRRAFRR